MIAKYNLNLPLLMSTILSSDDAYLAVPQRLNQS
jgi:hypothetical protein